jgi:hypothetical protein
MPINASGQISLLRVHDRGTAYGPPTDRIDVEVVMQFVGRPADAFGFQLRDDPNGPARQGMLDLLRNAFNHGWIAHIDFDIPTGKHNGTIIRTWITKPAGSTHGQVGGVLSATSTASERTRAASKRKRAASKRKKAKGAGT